MPATGQGDHIDGAKAPPSFRELFRAFTRIGLLSFGGPAGQIALMHREIVDERGWISEEQFLNALNFCHLLPGPEAQQLATWIGWRLHGLGGGLAAGLLFIIPGAIVILAMSMLYGVAAGMGWFAALFLGVKVAVLAIVVQALIRIAGRALDTGFKRLLAAGAFIALFFFGLPFPLIVLIAGLCGMAAGRWRPHWMALKPAQANAPPGPRPWGMSLRAIAVGGAIWAAPMLLIALTLGRTHVLWEIGSFFSQLAVVTFGGAYAVLAYMAQEAVQLHGWLNAGEMADGLGLAETTPGPLILVTQFVGYLAAYREAAPFTPFVAGLLGALLTSWVTFVPCFLWIFAFAPWIDRMQNMPSLKAGLAALSAAIVGVIANLSLWFALHVLFGDVRRVHAGPVRSFLPDPASLDWRAALIAAGAALLIFGFKRNAIQVLLLSALAGLGLSQI